MGFAAALLTEAVWALQCHRDAAAQPSTGQRAELRCRCDARDVSDLRQGLMTLYVSSSTAVIKMVCCTGRLPPPLHLPTGCEPALPHVQAVIRSGNADQQACE